MKKMIRQEGQNIGENGVGGIFHKKNNLNKDNNKAFFVNKFGFVTFLLSSAYYRILS